MKFTKKILAALLLSSTLLITGCGQLNIGYVDGAKIEQTPQMKAIIDEGRQKMQELQTQADKDLEGKSDEEKQKISEEVQRKAMGISQAYSTQLRHKLDTALEEISTAKNLDVVLDSSETSPTVPLGGIDVTEEVIQKLQ